MLWEYIRFVKAHYSTLVEFLYFSKFDPIHHPFLNKLIRFGNLFLNKLDRFGKEFEKLFFFIKIIIFKYQSN